MISRKHFEAIAASLKAVKPIGPWFVDSDISNKAQEWYEAHLEQWKADVEAVASELAKLNPRFDYSRFLSACGFKQREAA